MVVPQSRTPHPDTAIVQGFWMALRTALEALAVLAGVAMAADPPPRPQAPAVRAVRGAGIRLDGRPVEAAWRNGPWYDGFTVAALGRPAPVQTRFAVRFDDVALYLAAIMDEPEPDALRAAAADRDGPVFRDDCIEFMIDPVGDRVEYYHFAVNSRGTLYDAQYRQGGQVSTSAWNCDGQAAARVGDKSWSVEVRIPLAELGLRARSAEQPWAIQVGRERYAGGKQELSSYVPSGGSFHVVETYAPLILEKADLKPFLWDLQRPLGAMVVERDGRLQYDFRIAVVNQTGRFRFLRVRSELVRNGECVGSDSAVGGLDTGQQATYAFAPPFPENGVYLLRLVLADRRKPDAPLAVRMLPVELRYTPLTIDVLKPFYRNTIYATQRLNEIRARIRINLPPERVRGTKVRVVLRRHGAPSRKTVAEAPVVQAHGGVAEARLPIPVLPVGDYDLNVRAEPPGGNVYTGTVRIRKVPPVRDEWRIDSNLVLLHNGRPFFPYGWFSAPPEEGDKLRRESVNVIQDYNAEYRSVEEQRSWLDKVKSHGLYACFYPWPSRAFMKNFKQPVSAAEEKALRERIRALRDHPAIFAWYLWDEPELRPVLLDRAERLYQIIVDEDPYHPCIVLNDSIPGVLKYSRGADVLMPDPYPLFRRGGLAGRPIEYISRFMEACRRVSGGRKAWWITPQAFNYFNPAGTSRPPTLVELRNQQLQAIIRGAHGIFWYTYSHRYNYPELDLGVPFVGQEARRLESAILAPDTTGVLTWTAADRSHLLASVRRVGNNLVLFTVNTATHPQAATFRFDSPSTAPRKLWVVSEDRTVTVRNGVFSDHFETYGGHVYTTSKRLATGPVLDRVQTAIAEARRQLARPGNLAYSGRGTKVTASSVHRYSGKLVMTVDGARKGQGWTDGTWKKWPDWLEVRFPKPETVGRVRLWTNSIERYEIQVRCNGNLSTVARGVRKKGADSFEAVFPPQENVEAVRVVAKSATGAHSTTTEIEVYSH